MSVDNFLPTMWAGILDLQLQKNLAFSSIVDTSYQGTITGIGSSVKINTVSGITVGDYDATSDIASEDVSTTASTLSINQAKYFSFYVDDCDAAQAAGNIIDPAMEDAAYRLRDAADQYVLGLYTQAGNTVAGGNVNSANVQAALLACGEALDEQNVPQAGRWAVIPPWMKTKLLLAKTDVQAVGGEGWAGSLGNVAGFDIYVSNNINSTLGALCGYTRSINFVGQVWKIEAYRVEKRFKDGVKGLYLFGAKTTKPEALVAMTATETAES